MATKLKIPEERVNALFSKPKRYRLARDSSNPIASARRALRLYNTLIRDFDIDDRLAINAVFRHWSGAIDRAIQVVAERSKRPPGYHPRLWDSMVMYYPNPDDPNRPAMALWWNIRFPVSLDRTLGDSTADLYDVTADQRALDPFDIIAESDPSEMLMDLAGRAGVSPEQLQELLASFAAGDDLAGNDLMESALQKLKRAAVEPSPEDT